MGPVLQALLVADRVYEDKSGKKIIVGTFNTCVFRKVRPPKREVTLEGARVEIPAILAAAGSPYAYISLTNIHDSVTCDVRFVNLNTDEVLFHCSFNVKCNSPLETVEVVLPLPCLPPVVGMHALELLSDNIPLGAYRIRMQEISTEGEDDGSSR